MKGTKQEDNIFDLTAHESVWLGSTHAELLIKAFKAIANKELPAHFDEQPSTATLVTRTGVTWRALVKQAIFALEQNPHCFFRWFRSVLVNLSDYDRWRKATSEITRTQHPARLRRKKVLEGIKRHLEREQAEGRKGSQKRAWEFAKAEMPGSSYSEVIKALAIAEGGKKGRGRPRRAGAPQKAS